MSIQSNINQGIAITGALYSQTPIAEAAKEKAAVAREVKSKETEWHSLEQQENTLKDLIDRNQAAVEDINYYQSHVAPRMHSVGQQLNDARVRLNPESAADEIRKGYERGVGQKAFNTKLDRLRDQLTAYSNNQMPKKEDNVSKFYRELGGNK